MSNSSGPTVTIVGGGIAGLTSAYVLATRGYQVTLYEATQRVGGALSAVGEIFDGKDVNFECSPHMFGEWYDNFFKLMRDVGVDKHNVFLQSPKIAFLRRRQFLDYKWLINNGSIRDGLRNLFSGVASPANLFLYWYAILDILTQDFSDFSGNGPFGGTMSLNGFLVMRPYMSEVVLRFLQESMVTIWALDSYQTSIVAFQDGAKYQAKSPTPTAWLITDSNSYDIVIKPLQARLLSLGVRIFVNSPVLGVTVDEKQATVTCIAVKGQPEPISVDNLILAIPRFDLIRLVSTSAVGARSTPEHPIWTQKDLVRPLVSAALGETSGVNPDTTSLDAETRQSEIDKIKKNPVAENFYLAEQKHSCTIAEQIPSLANGYAAQGVPLAMLYVPLKRALPEIPECYVGFIGSKGQLSFINDPYLARRLGVAMVLAISISNFAAIPEAMEYKDMADIYTMETPRAAAIADHVLTEFGEFVLYDPDDIVWEEMVLKTNVDYKLFLNTVGSGLNAPDITYSDKLTNLFFAVQTKENPVQIATVEGAIIGGLQAAQALWTRNPSSDHNRNEPIEPIIPETYTQPELWAWKIALTPWAVAAKFWSDVEAAYTEPRPRLQGDANTLVQSAMAWAGAPFWFGVDAARLVSDSLLALRR